MYSRSRILILLIIPLMLYHSTAFSQESYLKWSPEDGVAIRQGWHVGTWDKSGTSRSEGELAGEVGFAWTDSRSGIPVVTVQVIDTNGELKFPENGLRLAITPGRMLEPYIHPATDGGWFLVWRDFRSNNGGDLYCTKIDREGRVLWGEDSGGVPVVENNSVNHKCQIVDDGEGGFIVAWQRPSDMVNMAILVMHIQSDGRQDPDWNREGLMIFNGNVYIAQFHEIKAATDNDGGMILSWFATDPQNPQDIWDVYAQRISPQGELLWGGQGGVRVSNDTLRQFRPQVCSDGEGGAFICWHNNGWREIRPALYAQRLDRDGNKMWDEDGEIISPTLESYFGGPCVTMVASGDGEAIVVWSDARDNNNSTDIYSMKFSGDEALVKLWEPEDGVPVCADDTSVFSSPHLCSDSEGGAYYTWGDERDGYFPETDIWAQHIDSDGDVSWEANGVPVYTGEYLQFAPLVFKTTDERCVVSWSDDDISRAGIGCQLMTREGEPVWVENGVSLVSGMSGDVEHPILFSHMNGEFGIVWLDSRNRAKYPSIYPYIQFGRDMEDDVHFTFPENGMPVLDPDSLHIVETIDAVKNIDGGIIITWTEFDRESRNFSGYVQRISSQGEPMWDEEGVRFSVDNDDFHSQICSDNEGGVYSAWNDTNDDNIYIQRFNGDGARQFDEDGLLLSSDQGESRLSDIIEDGEGGAVVLWKTYGENDERDIFAQRVNPDGSMVWDRSGLCVLQANAGQLNARIARHPEGFIFVWQDARDLENDRYGVDIYGQFVDPDGELYWQENGEPICSYRGEQSHPEMTIDYEGFIWVGWEDHRSDQENGSDIYIQKFYPDQGFPEFEFNMSGYELVAEEYNQHSIRLEHDGQNGLWAVWVEDDAPFGELGDLYALHVTPHGGLYDPWEWGGNPICSALGGQKQPVIARLTENGETGIVVAWVDGRSLDDLMRQNYNLYCQRVDDDFFEGSSIHEKDIVMTPLDFSITRIYPNPFNSTTTISYGLPYPGNVSLQVYNLSGQQITTLFEGYRQAGFHQTILNAANMPSGLYFVRLKASGQVFTRKVMLIR